MGVVALTQTPDEAIFNAVEGIADTIIEEGLWVRQHLDGPHGSLSRDLRKTGLKAQDIYGMTEDEAYIGRLTNSPGLRRVLMKLVREAFISAGDDMTRSRPKAARTTTRTSANRSQKC